MPDPMLTTWAARRGAGPVRGIALLLHGGRETDQRPVERQHASWWRMALLGRSLARSSGRAGVPVVLLRYRARGWNAAGVAAPAPVVDGRWALARLRERYGDVPVVLVGHSMGGRAAVALAGEPGVAGGVLLAPWLTEGEPVQAAAGQRLVVVHGLLDRWTSPAGSLAWSRRARSAGVRVARVELGPVGHFMLARAGTWNRIVRDASLGLLGVRPLPQPLAAALDAGAGEEGLRLPSPV